LRLLQLATLTAGGLLLVSLGAATLGAAPDAQVEVDGLRLDGPRILLSFELDGVFDDDFQRRIDSGLPTGFTVRFELLRDRKWWFDNTLDTGSLQVDAMYNAVNREYLINYKHDGSLIESRLVREPDELRRAMTEFTDFPVFSLAGQEARTRLQVRVRAELGPKTVLFFIPRQVRTEWVATRMFDSATEGG
jgi:hypothetical protein